jgi:Tol biopolymer transport system component
MKRQLIWTALIVACLLVVAPPPAGAWWVLDGEVICSEPNHQDYPVTVPDGSGGAIVAWRDARNGVDYDVYIQRIDHTGNTVWTLNGVKVINASGNQRTPALYPDGSGGVFVAWEDDRAGNYDIYTQYFDAFGNPQWTTNGVAVCTNAAHQMYSAITTDGSGGVIIAWQDQRAGGYNDIYVQRVDAAGVVQ